MWTNHLTVGVYLLVVCSSFFDPVEPSLITAVLNKTSGMTRNKVAEFFPEIEGDLTRVTWAHAVNSKERLESSLKDPQVMMLEADVGMGSVLSEGKEESSKTVAIMTHPPAKSSDLDFASFMETIISHTTQENVRKGVKLDIKDIKALHPVVKQLEKIKSSITFPVWLNADVWKGPVNSQDEPVDADEFIKLIQKKLKKISKLTLSLGWTTNYGHDNNIGGHKSENRQDKEKEVISSGQYTTEDVNTAIHFLKKHRLIGEEGGNEGTEITFPLRAGLAIQSLNQIEELLKEAGPDSTITLWSAQNDPKIDTAKLEQFVDKIGRHRTFLDLPFSVSFIKSVVLTTPQPTHAPTSSFTMPSTTPFSSERPSRSSRKSSKTSRDKDQIVFEESDRGNNGTEKPDEDNDSTAPSTSGSSVSSLSIILLFCCAVLLRPTQ